MAFSGLLLAGAVIAAVLLVGVVIAAVVLTRSKD